MHEVKPYVGPANGEVNKDNLFRKIWTAPRATLVYVLAKCPDEHAALLFVLGGITRSVGRALAHQQGAKVSVTGALILAIIGGSISGTITYNAYAWGMSLVGGWLGGRARAHQFKTVIGWALVPLVASLAFLVPTLLVVGGRDFGKPASAIVTVLLVACGVLEVGLGIWSTVILLKGVTLLQGFSTTRALANALLPGALLVLLILAVATLW